jgi:hypothetical protein
MLIGFKSLEERYGLALVQPLRIESTIGSVRMRQETPEGQRNQFLASYAPEDDFAGHFEFGLKYEEIHLEFFSRLFAATGPGPVEAWCRREPFGRSARRAGFFYEWLTGTHMDVPDLQNGGYIDALSRQSYLTRTKPLRDRRWRVNNNLPGTPMFCPLIRRTQPLQDALRFDPAAALDELDQRFGTDILLRSVGWLTLKESRASFLIEHEEDQTDRIRRFADVMAAYCGKIEAPLREPGLQVLQAGILGTDATGLGIRKSPVFVGQATLREDIVHYVAPPFEDVPPMLASLEAFELSTRGSEPLLRAGALAFAFIYLHPLRDGNGRIHRFLINDVLQRDQAIPPETILPVSASITNSLEHRVEYERALEAFSRPFLRRYGSACHFGEMTTAADGTRTNFHFGADEDARAAWRYPDLTEQALFVARLVANTISVQMAEEAHILRQFQTAQEHVKDLLEMPDPDVNRLIRSIRENGWSISGKLQGEYPRLENPTLAASLVEAVRSAFQDGVRE